MNLHLRLVRNQSSLFCAKENALRHNRAVKHKRHKREKQGKMKMTRADCYEWVARSFTVPRRHYKITVHFCSCGNVSNIYYLTPTQQEC